MCCPLDHAAIWRWRIRLGSYPFVVAAPQASGYALDTQKENPAFRGIPERPRRGVSPVGNPLVALDQYFPSGFVDRPGPYPYL